MVSEQCVLQGNFVITLVIWLYCMAFVKLHWGPSALGKNSFFCDIRLLGIISFVIAILASHRTHEEKQPTRMPMPEGCHQTHVLDRWCVGGIPEGGWCGVGSQSHHRDNQSLHQDKLAKNIIYSKRICNWIWRECFARLDAGLCFLDTLTWNPLVGIRIGEAKNPGPIGDRKLCTFAITNPTSIGNKQTDYLELMHQHSVDVVACSETSATDEIQKKLSKAFRMQQVNCLWSNPVPPQTQKLNLQPSKRGKAGGTAVLTTYAARNCWNRMDTKWYESGRLLHVVMQLGSLWVQCFVVYGLPSSIAGAKEFNNALVSYAITSSRYIPIPAVFMGDFNMNVHDLQDFGQLYDEGYRSLQQIHERLYGRPMDKTCKEATIPDTAVLHPLLAERVYQMEVSKEGWFDAHNPVIFSIQLPLHQLFVNKVRMPESWAELPITMQDLEQTGPIALQQCGECETLEQWAFAVETAVDLAIQKDHQNDPSVATLKKLPPKYRGRCKPVKLQQCPVPGLIKKAWNGHYNPNSEHCSFRMKKMVRQLRRITPIKLRIQKLSTYDQIWHRSLVGISQEWNVICCEKFEGEIFSNWMHTFPELLPFPQHLPEVSWLQDLEKLWKHEVDHISVQETKSKNLMAKIKHKTDVQDGHYKNVFAFTKGTGAPPFTSIASSACDVASVVPTDCPKIFELYVDLPNRFFAQACIKVDETIGFVKEVGDFHLTVWFHEIQDFPEDVHISQDLEHIDPQVIHNLLFQYWNQFWTRDPIEQNFEEDHPAVGRLLNHLPQDFSPTVFQESDINEWKAVIKQTKSSSSPGVDGVYFAELKKLPDCLLGVLISILCSLVSFPEHLMIARTVALPKVNGCPQAKDSRPITIMASLYKLWSKMICQSLLKYLGKKLPNMVTGLLPGRGAKTAIYDFQALIEIARSQKLRLTGVTLDLRKCFNLINRTKARKLLQLFAIPNWIIDKWFLSIQKLKRFWDLGGACSDLQGSTTGIPEGDAFSVLIMVVIAAAWTYVLVAEGTTLDASAYADNWSWWASNAHEHNNALDWTTVFTDWMGLQIDWEKTWQWATDPQNQTAVNDIVRRYAPKATIVKLQNAWDLGAPVNYQGFSVLGKFKDRLTKAKQRLARIQMSKWSLSVKVHAICGSVYPAALYASELFVLGQQHLDSFRTAIANAIVGDVCQSLNPAIFLSCLHIRLVDPHLYIILQAIKEARRFLFRCSDETKSAFLRIASTPLKTVGRSAGPASALKEYLHRIGWIMDKDGNIQVTNLHFENLLNAPYSRIKEFVIQAWQEQLLVLHTQRKHLFNLGTISRNETLEVLQKFCDKSRLLILRQIAGAFQTRHQQAAWDEEVTPHCLWCDALDDTLEHRLYYCPAFEQVRAPYLALIGRLNDKGSCWPLLPVIMQHEDHDYFQILHHNMPEAQFSDLVKQQVGSSSHLVNLYSDGSCHHPQHRVSRFASYAIVMDLCETDQQRRFVADQSLHTGSVPNSFVVVAKAKCRHEQNISRAELWALVRTCESLPCFVLHTDSAFALQAWQRVQMATCVSDFQDHPHFDLLKRLWQVKNPRRQILKIKAHRHPDGITDSLERYHAYGNARANDEAIHTNLHFEKPLVDQFQARHQRALEDKDELENFFHLIVDLQYAQAKAGTPANQQNVTKPIEKNDHTANNPLEDALINWAPEPGWSFPTELRLDWLSACAWGVGVATAFLQWFRGCVWGNDTTGPLGYHMGISWLEIAFAVMLQYGAPLPIKRKIRGIEKLIHLISPTDIAMHNVTLDEMTQNVYSIYRNVVALIPQHLVPLTVKCGKNRSLQVQGLGIWTTGFNQRPSYHLQDKVYWLVQSYVDAHTVKKDEEFPFPTELCTEGFALHPDDCLQESIWDKRYKNSLSKMKMVQASRKGLR